MSLIKSIKNNFCPIHREGFPFIAVFLVITLGLSWLWWPLSFLGIVLTCWCTYFFRDPSRVTPLSSDLVVSPADGRVSFVGEVVPPEELGLGLEKKLRISVFMNVFNCHVNRFPISGQVKSVIYRPGKFINAELDKASEHNERNSLVIDTAHGDIGVVQIAGLVARRIVCWTKLKDRTQTGKRFGLIRFGSRLDVYLPITAKIQVAVGQSSIAGETVLAAFDDRPVLANYVKE